MDNLSLIEQEALVILKQLEYCCESAELHQKEEVANKKSLMISINDIDTSVLKRPENLYTVAKYLQNNGLDFNITFDLINDHPDMYINADHPTWDFIQLGIIKGENIESIIKKVKEMILKLSPKNMTRKNTIKGLTSANNNEIKQLELLKDETENKKITVYINIDYNIPRYFNRRKYWGLMYELAKEQQVPHDKGFFDYFNSNPTNPLYIKEGFKITKILKEEYKSIVPNIKIEIVTPRAVTQRLNSA